MTMAWKQLPIGQLLVSIGHIISLDFMKHLARNTLNFVGGWMGRVARAKREVITKRLRKRRKRLEACRMVKRGLCKCSCAKCSYVQRRRVLEPDYLDNLAYQRRISQDISPAERDVPESPELPLEELKVREDHRDLQQLNYDGVVWWTGVNHRVLMPPLLNNLPTRSNYSSTSGFRSASPDILESNDTINTSDGYDSSDYQSCWEDSSSPRTMRMSSKSEPRVANLRTEQNRVTRTSRSASMPLGHQPNHQDTSQLASDPSETPDRRKKRPVSSKTTASHVCDTFSTCVKCSNTASKPSKRATL